jgi:hypothetical protein
MNMDKQELILRLSELMGTQMFSYSEIDFEGNKVRIK